MQKIINPNTFAPLLDLWWLIPIAIIAFVFKTPTFKGWLGEFIVRIASKIMLDKKIYHPFHDVMLSTPDGTTQIDHIFVSKFGIFVVETKNMKGWIFGNPNQSMWTQQIYKVKNQFQNPLRQNYKHSKAIHQLLDISEEAIIPLVVFVSDATFKTSMPENVTRGIGFIRYIKEKQTVRLEAKQVTAAIAAIKSGKLSSPKVKKEHIERLKSRSDSESKQLCPKCGSEMVLRTARSTGKQFWGCSRFPTCKVTRQINK